MYAQVPTSAKLLDCTLKLQFVVNKSPVSGAVTVARFVGLVNVNIYTRGPHSPGTFAVVALESEAGANV